MDMIFYSESQATTWFGRKYGMNNSYYKGYLDDIKIWKRALTEDEIVADYAPKLPEKHVFDGIYQIQGYNYPDKVLFSSDVNYTTVNCLSYNIGIVATYYHIEYLEDGYYKISWQYSSGDLFYTLGATDNGDKLVSDILTILIRSRLLIKNAGPFILLMDYLDLSTKIQSEGNYCQ